MENVHDKLLIFQTQAFFHLIRVGGLWFRSGTAIGSRIATGRAYQLQIFLPLEDSKLVMLSLDSKKFCIA